MDKIQLRENTTNGKTITVLVSKKTHSQLEEMQYMGGFLRYSISFLDNGIKGKTKKCDIDNINAFLNSVFITKAPVCFINK